MNLYLTIPVFLLGIVSSRINLVEGRAMDKENIEPLQHLSSFKGYSYDFTQGPQGVYKFYYNLPQSSRFEERSDSGEVRGNYAYVAPEGDEFKFKYEAGKKGFQVESNALPTAPEDTDEVKRAKKEFFEAYKNALALVELDGYGNKKSKGKGGKGDENGGEEESEEEEDEEEEDEEESSEEKDDHESSEEADVHEDENESSEENDNEEDNEESSEEDDEEVSEKSEDEIKSAINLTGNLINRRRSSSFQLPNYIYKDINQVPPRRRLVRTYNSRARSPRPNTWPRS